jgi:hypothetical protein
LVLFFFKEKLNIKKEGKTNYANDN